MGAELLMFQRIKDRVAYERESYRMSQEHLRKIAAELPYPKGYWRMTTAEIEQWRRDQAK